eukprot:gene34413-biopygen29041
MRWSWGLYLMIYTRPRALISFEQELFEGSSGSWYVDFPARISLQLQLQRQRPPDYILENVSPLAHRPGTKIRDEVFPYIASVIGRPVSFDAARAGSKLAVDMPVHGAVPSTRVAWGAAPYTSWESQQSSRQWEPGWEANIAEQDEVLPYTVLDEL